MDQEKPFKTIEVIDSRTSQLCKVACMSCIRGHRTTSCGIPVCRPKVFWTVKRPGRPSNSCTCQFGATGGCKCVVARSACPHKPKKGEKRSGGCRCDENGRYCCLLEPHHWDALMALQKPSVDFYPTREALQARFAAPTPASVPAAPVHHGTPPTFSDVPATPGPINGTQTVQMMSPGYDNFNSPRSATLTPRFGMMGIGAPQGSDGIVTPDVLSWDGEAPRAPREYSSTQYQQIQQEERPSCCQGSTRAQQEAQGVHSMPPGQSTQSPQPSSFPPFGQVMQNVPTEDEHQLQQAEASFSKLSNDFFHYQFPSAICQTCGLNGCTCRNCPPVMQNFSTGSWAQCCGRKHARTATYVPPTAQHEFRQPSQPPQHLEQPPSAEGPQFHHSSAFPNESQLAIPTGATAPGKRPYVADSQQPSPEVQPLASLPDFEPFDPGPDFTILDGASDIDISEFLMAELERPSEGCCCGDP